MLKNVYDLNETQRGYRVRWREETRCKHSQQKDRERNNFFFFFCQLWFYVVKSVTNQIKVGSHDDNKRALQRQRCHVYHEGDLHNTGCKEGGGKQELQDSD